MKLTPAQKDLLEDLLKHNGFDVLGDIADQHHDRLINRLVQPCGVEETARIRGEIGALTYLRRETLTKLIRDAP